MREVRIQKRADKKMIAQVSYVRFIDMEKPMPSLISGEWVVLYYGNERRQVGIVDIEGKKIDLVDFDIKSLDYKNDEEIGKKILMQKIQEAIARRDSSSSRLFFGMGDGVPGLVIDGYENTIMIQAHSYGVYRYQKNIRSILQKEIPGKPIFFTKTPAGFEYDKLSIDHIEVKECKLQFVISSTAFQKNGYYYDHQANRQKMSRSLKDLGLEFSSGLDLYCYVGSWGIHALNIGVKRISFVDQGDLHQVVMENVRRNGFGEGSEFIRSDVQRFLKKEIESGKRYDLIISDPPAFSKSSKSLKAAKDGYRKLYNNIFQLIDDGYVVVASCTFGISFDELSSIVSSCARSVKRKIRMIDIGIQNSDHPFTSLDDKNCYIKYFLYKVEMVGD